MQINEIDKYSYLQNSKQVKQRKNQNDVAFKALLDVQLAENLEKAPLSGINRVLDSIKSSSSFQRLCQVTDVKIRLEHDCSGSGVQAMFAHFFAGDGDALSLGKLNHNLNLDEFTIYSGSASSFQEVSQEMANKITEQLDDRATEAVGNIAYSKAVYAMNRMSKQEYRNRLDSMMDDLKNICNGGYSNNNQLSKY